MIALEQMYQMFPDAHGELISKNPFELLIAVILSAQATDVSVNKVTPTLFAAYPTPEALAAAPVEEIIEKIRTIGLYRNKAKISRLVRPSLSNDSMAKYLEPARN